MRRAILLSGLALLAVVVALLTSAGARRSAPALSGLASYERPPATPPSPAQAPESAGPRAAAGRARPDAAPARGAEPCERVLAVLDETEHALRSFPTLHGWEVRTAAVTADWGEVERACLEEQAGRSSDLARVLVTVELLRALPPAHPAGAPPAALDALREGRRAPEVPVLHRTLAAAGLSALGTYGDALELLEELEHGPEAAALAACRGLARGRDPAVLPDLLQVAGAGGPRGELALIALRELAGRIGSDPGLASGLERIALDRARPRDVRARSLAALSAWAPERVLEAVLRLAEEPDVDAALLAAAGRELRSAGGGDATRLELGLQAPDLPRGARIALAEAVASSLRAGPERPRLRDLALHVLGEGLETELPLQDRRRALFAYASLARGAADARLQELAESDPDPSMRSAAARLLAAER